VGMADRCLAWLGPPGGRVAGLVPKVQQRSFTGENPASLISTPWEDKDQIKETHREQ
jgi:hypothetical protein